MLFTHTQELRCKIRELTVALRAAEADVQRSPDPAATGKALAAHERDICPTIFKYSTTCLSFQKGQNSNALWPFLLVFFCASTSDDSIQNTHVYVYLLTRSDG